MIKTVVELDLKGYSDVVRELEDHLDEEEADELLEQIINWGRHAELFAYDYDTGILSLENP